MCHINILCSFAAHPLRRMDNLYQMPDWGLVCHLINLNNDLEVETSYLHVLRKHFDEEFLNKMS